MKAKNIQILIILSLYIFSCTKFDLPEKCNDAIPTNLLLKGSTFPSEIVLSKNDVNPLTITTEGNYTLNWTITGAGANVVYTGVGQSASLLKTYPNGIYVVKATGKNSCGFNFTIEKTIKFCVDSSPSDINIVVNADRTATCTLVAGGSQKVDWTLVDKTLNTSILVATGTDKATIDPIKYPSGNYILKATGKSECNIDFTLTKDYSNDYFDIFAISNSSVNVKDVATDKIGNIYITGTFSGQWTTSKGTLTSEDGAGDIYVAKYTKFGVLEWIESARSIGSDNSNSVAVDASGNVYITGSNNNSTLFGNVAIARLSNPGGFFLVKYNTNGTVQWLSKGVSSTSIPTGVDVCIDTRGWITVLGSYGGDIKFDDDKTLNGFGLNDIFVINFTPQGSISWKQNVGSKNGDFGNGIAVDLNFNVYITGSSNNSTSPLNIGNGTNYGSTDIFLIKFNTNGAFQWLKNAGGSGDEFASSISLDRNNNIYIAGIYFSSSMNFDSKLLNKRSVQVASYIAKYNDSGVVQWAESSLSGDVFATGLVTDIDGNSYMIGRFGASADFSGALSKFTTGGTDVFITKFLSDGKVQWVETLGGIAFDFGNNITIDGGKNVYAVGIYNEILSYKGKQFTTVLGNSGRATPFLLRLDK